MNSPLTPVVVKIKHRHEASAESVFDAWTQAELARQFLFASDGGETTDCEIDARTAGSFKIVHRIAASDGQTGQQTLEYVGHYIELVRPTRLVFSFSVTTDSTDSTDETVVAIDLAPLSTGGCDVILSHSLGSSDAARQAEARTETSWTKTLHTLDKVLAKQKS